MSPSEQHIFFELLRASIWQREADLSFFQDSSWSWSPILRALDSHSLLALAAGAIMTVNNRLPASQQLNPSQSMELMKYCATVAKTHFDLNRAVVDIFSRLSTLVSPLHPVLLKGQGLAAIYPMANTRSCGDIDIYVGKEGYDNAKSIINNLCTSEEIQSAQEDIHQYHITHDSTTYELHPVAGFCAVAFRQKEYEAWAAEQLQPSKCDRINIDLHDGQEHPVLIPNAQFNIPYLFDHLCRHFRFQGVGVRQFVDIAILLHQTKQDQNFLNTLKKDLKRLDLFNAWQILSGILVINLGLPESECPFYDNKKAQKSQTQILQNVIADSHFGFNTDWRHEEEQYAYGFHRVLLCYRQQWRYLHLNHPLFPLFSLYEFLRQTTRTLFIALGLKKENY